LTNARHQPIKTYKPNAKTQRSFGLCIYGQGGVGKTSLLRTMPGKGLVIDVPQVEGGTFVLEDVADRIDVTEVRTWNEIEDVYWQLKEGKHQWQWVAIDSITGFQELAKRRVVAERSLDADPHVIGLQEWGKMGQLIGDLVYRFRTLPTHTIWIAQERKHGGGDDGGPVMMGPDVIPSALSALKPSMLMMGRMYVEMNAEGQWERRLRVQPHPDYHAKIRVKPGIVCPAVFANPSLNDILRFVFGTGPQPEAATESALIITV